VLPLPVVQLSPRSLAVSALVSFSSFTVSRFKSTTNKEFLSGQTTFASSQGFMFSLAYALKHESSYFTCTGWPSCDRSIM
jgi:hypothetical protein